MLREGSLEEFSDGKLYDLDDMVKADCHDCRGCSACCRGMGTSITLDPLDLHRISQYLGVKPEALLTSAVELNVTDGGIILPNIAMKGEEEACSFLNAEGRCTIHPARPGICRLFPLGRYYEEGKEGFRYFLQTNECLQENRSKVKVKKWIDTPEAARYDAYVASWHGFLKKLQERGADKDSCMYLLKAFYLLAFRAEDDFYAQFEKRLAAAEERLLKH